MRYIIKILLRSAILFVAGLAPYFTNAQETASFQTNGRVIAIKPFDREVDRIITEMGIPAISLAVIEDNKIVYYNAYGHKRAGASQRVDKNSVFEACSLSKSLVTYCAYTLIDEGRLDWNRPLYLYFPYERLAYDPRYKQITARMVLSHTSGLENWQSLYNSDTLQLLSNPGEQYIYSGEGYQYLYQVMEAILHQPYERYVDSMLLKPLGMHNTLLTFGLGSTPPPDFATGHDNAGRPLDKWEHSFVVPASGVNLTAEDYARLLIALFDGQHFSPGIKRKLLEPIAWLGALQADGDSTRLYYGPGFELLCSKDDTVILHGGNNYGYKAMMCYSVVYKRGMVLLTNSDLGKWITRRLCKMTVGLDIDPYFTLRDMDQYPGNGTRLFLVYRRQGAAALFKALDSLEKATHGRIGVTTLNELGGVISDLDKGVAKRLLRENARLYPRSAYARYLLGQVEMDLHQYGHAYRDLLAARDLHYIQEPIDPDLAVCIGKMREAKKNTAGIAGAAHK